MVETCHIDLPELNRSLKKALLLRRESDRGVVCHNQGGWHSERDMLSWGEPCVKALLLVVSDHAPRDMEMVTAWANINEPGDFNKKHIHQGDFERSGFYVVAGDTGETVFDPGNHRVKPMPGLLAMFDSNQWHRVEPCDKQRITVAFNFARLRVTTKEN